MCVPPPRLTTVWEELWDLPQCSRDTHSQPKSVQQPRCYYSKLYGILHGLSVYNESSMIYNIEILINVYCTYSTWWIELRKGWALGDAKKCLITQALPKPPTFSALGPFSKALIEYSSGVVFVYLRVNTRKVLVKHIAYSYTTWKRETVKFAHYILATEHNLS
jgi:hypothetical protein